MSHLQNILDFIAGGNLLAFSENLNSVAPLDQLKLTDDTDMLERLEASRATGEIAPNDLFEDWKILKEDENSKKIFTPQMKDVNVPLDLIMKHVSAYIPIKFSFLTGSVGGDLYNSARLIEGYGELDGLHKYIYDAYMAGGFPCGWEGRYPRGRLCMFWDPNNKTPEPEETITLKRMRLQQQILQRKLQSNT